MGSTSTQEFGMPKGHLSVGKQHKRWEPRLKASLWNRNKGLDIVRTGWGKESRMRRGRPPVKPTVGIRAAASNPREAVTAAREVSEEGGPSMLSTGQVKGRED